MVATLGAWFLCTEILYKMVSEFWYRDLVNTVSFQRSGMSNCESWKWCQKWPSWSCPRWQCSPWQRWSSSGAVASPHQEPWAQGLRQYQLPWGQGWSTSTEPQRLCLPARDHGPNLVPPVAVSSHRDDGELGQDVDGYLCKALDAQIDMPRVTPDSDRCLEPGSHWSAQVCLIQGCSQEKVSNLRFLDSREKK